MQFHIRAGKVLFAAKLVFAAKAVFAEKVMFAEKVGAERRLETMPLMAVYPAHLSVYPVGHLGSGKETSLPKSSS